MRLYGPARRNIAKRLKALLLAGPLVAACLTADAAASFDDYSKQSAEAFERQAKPPVMVARTTLTGNALQMDLRVQPWITDNTLEFVLAAPDGDITSASLTVDNLGEGDRRSSLLNDNASSTSHFQRELVASARHLAWIRGTRLVKIQVPAIVPGTMGRRVAAGRLQITYDQAPVISPGRNALPGDAPDAFETMLSRLVANPADLKQFAVALSEAPTSVEAAPVAIGQFPDAVARFSVSRDGFVQFSGADLAAAGVDLTTASVNRVSVWCEDMEQPVFSPTAAGAERPVKPDDTFIVYGNDNDSTYTVERDYWIRITGIPARPMHFVDGITVAPDVVSPNSHFWTTMLVEKDVPPVLTKNDQFLTILGYRWVWWSWTPDGNGNAVPDPRDYQTTGSLNFDLPGLAETDTSVPLTLHFYAHHWTPQSTPIPFQVEVNGNVISHVTVSEPTGLDHTVYAPPDALRQAGNTMVLTPQTTAVEGLPEISFDRLEIRYPRTYELTSHTLEFTPPADDGGPVAVRFGNNTSAGPMIADVSGEFPQIYQFAESANNGIRSFRTVGPATRSYVAVTPEGIAHAKLQKVERRVELRSLGNKADLIVIAWPEFIEDLKPWVEARRGAGHAVQVVDVHDIYDQFGFGHQSPYAIRAFLHYAAVYWQGSEKGPAASVVVLVGDSTSAYRDEFRNDVINYVPTMRLVEGGDPFASDQWFVTLFGNDPFADAMIGRFSVNSREDLRNVIRKQLDYENKSATGAWKNTLGFIADHSEFEESVDRVMRHGVPPRFFMEQIRMEDLPWIDNYYFPKELADARQAKVSPAATRKIRDLFNNGAAVVTYFGHGSPNIWSNERMWFGGDSPNSDNLLLTNRDRLPIVINMTCNSGAIDYPQPRWNICISEDFMRVPNGGAVACFVPSGPGLTVQHEKLMMEVGQCLFGPDTEPIGQSMQLALWKYLADGNPADLAKMYILLGDPLLLPHISKSVELAQSSSTTSPAEAANPGVVPIPADLVKSGAESAYQFTKFADSVEPGAVIGITNTATAIPALSSGGGAAAKKLALSVSGTNSSATQSTVVPVANLDAVTLVQWKRIDKPAAGDTTATLELRLRNEASVPVSGLRLVASSDSDKITAEPLHFALEAFEEVFLQMEVPAADTLTPLKLIISDGQAQREVKTDVPVAVASLRSDEQRDELPPAEVDPRSITVRYRQTGDKMMASVSCFLYITSQEALSNLRIGLEDDQGIVVQDSIVTVPPVSPGEGTRVTLNVTLPSELASAEYKLRFDPSGYYPEFTRFPSQAVKLGKLHYADIVLAAASPSDPSPTDGETVFFDVTVKNAGEADLDGVKVTGDWLTTSGKAQKLDAQVAGEAPLVSLQPGQSERVRLRWDPFQNAGENRIRLTAKSIYGMPDSDPSNNTRNLSIDVRSKASVRFIRVGVLQLTPADRAARQVRLTALLKNVGESEAVGMRVVFYNGLPHTENNYLGEVELDSLKPGETKSSTLTYKLKPGEEHKPIQTSCEVLYKGSRQRISVN